MVIIDTFKAKLGLAQIKSSSVYVTRGIFFLLLLIKLGIKGLGP